MTGPVLALLATLRRLGVRLQAAGDRLTIDAPAGVLTDDLWARIRQHKRAIIALLALSDPAVDETKATECPSRDDRGANPARTPLKSAQAKSKCGAAGCGERRHSEEVRSCEREARIDADGWMDPTAWPNGKPDWLDYVMSPAFDDETQVVIEEPMLPNGWTRRAWIARLRQLADRCQDVHPDLAEKHRQEADRLEDEVR